jgi:hypothetical protein
MARKRQTEESAVPSNGWIVTFSDCMTLLLCFFVMLMSFSSFDKATLAQFGGAFQEDTRRWASQQDRPSPDSYVPPRPRRVDYTQYGSELPEEREPESIINPRRPDLLADTEAYRDRKVFRIPSKRMFWGNGTSMTADGRRLLDTLAGYLRLLPCDVVVSERPGEGERGAGQRGLVRSLAIVEHLTDREGIPGEQFHVSSGGGPTGGDRDGAAMIEIVVFARGVYR